MKSERYDRVAARRPFAFVRENLLDAAVGLPAQLFPTTGNPVCIMVFDKAREVGLRSHERHILFIDASRSFEMGGRSRTG